MILSLSRRASAVVVLAALASAQATRLPGQDNHAAQATGVPFRELDTVEGAWIEMMAVPVRPMARDSQTGHLFAVNSHDSTMVEFDTSDHVVQEVRVPWGPVSLALWDHPTLGESALVVCRGTYTLVRVDLATGEIASMLELPTEPADILVHPTSGHAFVSCSGDDSVVEVDVSTNSVVKVYRIPAKKPTFLTLDGEDVLVAPMLSGNNSTADTGPNLLDVGARGLMDLEDATVAIQGLADHDLFRITPGSDAVPVARDMGAVLFAVGTNPVTGDVWQLGTEANNKDPLKMGEPAIRGDIVVNQIAIAQLANNQVVEPFDVLDLDDSDPATPGVQFDTGRTVGQPYSIAFDGSGDAYVVGLLTDNVTQLTAAGGFVREFDVGSIPRAILVNDSGSRAWVYFWGENGIRQYSLTSPSPIQVGVMNLGYDPAPRLRRVGREIFFDARHSMHNNASCASCHVEGETDMLLWNLSNLPFDDKGPLVTQTMRGIADLTPFHWRGERAGLEAFNPAFDGLLGSLPLSESDFDAFEAFVFSMEQPANPFEHESRLVYDFGGFRTPDGVFHPANAVIGQDRYFDTTAIPFVGSCNTCHTLPTGTSNDIVFDEPNLQVPSQNHFVVASYNGMWRKKQRTLETIILADNTIESRPTTGAGVSIAGLKDSVFDFVNLSVFSLGPAQRRHISAFVQQIDSGLAPAVHKAWLLNDQGTTATAMRIKSYLLDQAERRNVDVVAFGRVDLGNGPVELRWLWNRETGLFVAERSTVPDLPIGFFVEQAFAGRGSVVFAGVPVGMGERFGVDFDGDDLYNGDEKTLGTDPENPDSDGDGDPDGHEAKNGGDPTDAGVLSNDTTSPTVSNVRLVYTTTRVAKIQFDADEPVSFVATWVSGNLVGETTSELFQKKQTVVFKDLRVDQNHDVTIDVTDHGGNTVQVTLPNPVQTLDFTPVPTTVFRNATVTEVQDSAGTLHVTIAGKVRNRGGNLASGRQLRVKVFVNGVETQPMLTGTVSTGSGDTSVDVIESGLVPGDEVRVVVFTLFHVPTADAASWSMPDTSPDDREFIVTYTGTGQ